MLKLIHSDCVAAMKDMPDCSVDSIVTDPPYELGFMGKKWDSTGIAYSVEMWEQCLRILKPGGHLLAFSGSRTYHRMTVAIEDAGFDIRDQIMWVYGSGFPKSHNLDGDWQGWGTALKPAHEPICVARKPLVGTVAANVLAHGTGAINIDGCRVGTTVETWPKSRSFRAGISSGYTDGIDKGATQSTGDAPAGRWPANLIHDGSEEVLAGFPQTTSGNLSPHHKLKASDNRSMRGGNQERSPRSEFGGDTGSAARFFYCAKASKRDRDEGLDEMPDRVLAMSNQAKAELARGNMHEGDSGMNSAKIRKNNHPTVKPTDLMRYLCRLVTPPSGIVLDPFMGSGSTGKAAKLEGFGFIGIEQNQEYIDIASARINNVNNNIVKESETLELFA